MTKVSTQLLAIAIAAVSTVSIAAQEKPAAAQPNRPAPASLKVSLVFSRSQGDKKITSIPHTILVATDGNRTSLRLGTQLPVPTTTIGEKGAIPSYSYKDVGMNLDCSANAVQDGAYRLTITISDSSVYYPDQSDAAAKSVTASTGAPAFRAFNTTFALVLHDGQAAPTTSVTDPISGQVIKVDATINVVK